MNSSEGLRRIKIVWAAICILAGSAIAALLLMSSYRSEIMQGYASLTMVMAGITAFAPFANVAVKTRVAMVPFAGGILYAMASVLNGHMTEKDMVFFTMLIVGSAGAWAIAAAAEWIFRGFKRR